MIWIIIIILLLVLLVYLTGSFITRNTTIVLTEVNREIDQCFAIICNKEHLVAKLPEVTKLDFSDEPSISAGQKGTLFLNKDAYPFEVVTFIPNYRIAVQHQSQGESLNMQLSFYRLSRTSTRVVLIATVRAESRFKRVLLALQKKSREEKLHKMLTIAKEVCEQEELTFSPYSDVSAEENPNFSLR